MKLKYRHLPTACLLFFIMLSVVCPVAAQNAALLDKPAQVTMKKATFTDILKALTKQYGLNFVADGEPLLKATDFEANGALHQVLDKLAETFDLTWQATKSGVIVLNKRFENSNEMPQAVPAEMQRMAKDIVSALSAFDYDTGYLEPRTRMYGGLERWRLKSPAFYASITPDQVKTMQAGKRIPLEDLPSAQRDMLRDLILTACFSDPRDRWLDVNDLISVLPNSNLYVPRYNNTRSFTLTLREAGGQALIPAFDISSPLTGPVLIKQLPQENGE